MSDNKIKFFLNDKQVEANKDETIWQVANRLGTEIPHLCYTNKPGYRADGNCRACMVEIEGEHVLAASCIRKPSNNLKVKTSSEKAKKSRKLVFELLLTDQPDRDVAQAILNNFKCTGVAEYSINYPVANTEKSVQSNFFVEGNKIMKKFLNLNENELFPWSK